MGVIKKIREHTGLAVGIIAFGLILFIIGGDLLSMNSLLLQGDRNVVGNALGEDITYEAYTQKLQELTDQYSINTKEAPNEQALTGLRQQSWEALVQELIYGYEYARLGLTVTPEEVIDMVQGDHIRANLKVPFTNPETNQFERERLEEYLRNFDKLSPLQQALWHNYERDLWPTRMREKYENLFTKSIYLPEEEMKYLYNQENESISIRYLYVPYTNMPDSNFSVTDSQVRQYLETHALEYEREWTRSVRYVHVALVPSAADSLATYEEVRELQVELGELEEDSLFCLANSDGKSPYAAYTPDKLPEMLQESIDTMAVGAVIGPVEVEGRVALYKLSSVDTADEGYARASHILLRAGEDKEKTRKEAKDLLARIKRGESFEELAKVHGTDGTASKGGDLGWFSKGRMVPDFEKAVFEAKAKGLIPRLVETNFGFHLIKVTQTLSNQSYAICSIEKDVLAGDETQNLAYEKASNFRRQVQDTSSFRTVAEEMTLAVERDEEVKPDDKEVALLRGRALVRWLFNEAEAYDISNILELEDGFAIALMDGEQPEGVAVYASVEEEIKEKLLNKKKGKAAIEQLGDPTDSFETLASRFPSGKAYIYSSADIKLASMYLNNVGLVPEAIGLAFSLDKVGERSKPFLCDEGLLLMELTKEREITQGHTRNIRRRKRSEAESSLPINIREATEEFAEVEDKRYKFY